VIENKDYVICQLCKKKYKVISNKHLLFKHNISIAQYKENFPNEWKYAGDGSLIIRGKCPDFVNVNGRKLIIEVFGDYWHSEERVGKNSKEHMQDRINIFSVVGYKKFCNEKQK